MKKTKIFLLASSVTAFIICAGVFVWLMTFMDRKSEESVRDIGTIYMAEMDKHIRQKFLTILDFRFMQMQGIVKRTPPQSVKYGEAMLKDLRLNAEVREFAYLGLLARNGEMESVYGSPVTLADTDYFWTELAEDGKVITHGTNRKGERLLIEAVPAAYPMKGGETSMALVAGTSMTALRRALFNNENERLVTSHVVDRNGRFLIRSTDSGYNNYFQRVRENFSSLGKKTALHYAREIRQAMDEGSDYSTLIRVGDEFRHLYLSSLPDSEWFLVSELPQGVLDSSISQLSNARVYSILVGAGIVFVALLIIFGYYYFLSQAQMSHLNGARLEADRANRAKSEFLSNMSHDIRTPMNAVIGMTDIALSNLPDSNRVEDCLKKIKLSSRHLLGLINDILDMSKIESGKLSLNIERASLRDLMDDMVNIMQPQLKAKKQHFDIFIEKIQAENVQCDPIRLNQILLNLLSNAVKFTPDGGAVHIYLQQEDSPKGKAYVRTHLRVKDTGIGMSPEFKDKIFESFSREDNRRVLKIMGTGLGMAIVKYLVTLMGGTIEVDSVQGEGTEFHVTLDFKRADLEEENMKLPSWKVLVVDDSEELRVSAAQVLSEMGVEADTACGGEEAVQMMEGQRAKGNNYDIVLLDWKMPGMDGLDTLHEIHKRIGKDVAVCLISAYDWSEIEQEAREAGVEGFLSKPLFKSTLFYGLSKFTKCDLAEEPKTDPHFEVQSLAGKRILLAEDNELNWEVANEILAEAGLEVEWAENGAVCVEKFKNSEPGYYDAILMDIRMPEMTGYEAAKAIRALSRPDKELPIIAMTADAFSEDIQRCLACGMNAHTAKPINTKELFRLLCKHLKCTEK